MSRSAILQLLRADDPLIAPSMLKCDFGNLHREVELLESAGARMLHWDVMDGHFVPNLTYGPTVIRSVRPLTNLLFDAHLMIADPERYLDEYLEAGCNAVSVHVEAVRDPTPVLRRIRAANAAAGLALNPGTPVKCIEPFLEECDVVLVMSVEPGFGGQSFLPSAVDKLRQLRRMVSAETVLSVDGGLDESTIGSAAQAGADLFVAGSAVFDTPDYAEAILRLARASGRCLAASAEED